MQSTPDLMLLLPGMIHTRSTKKFNSKKFQIILGWNYWWCLHGRVRYSSRKWYATSNAFSWCFFGTDCCNLLSHIPGQRGPYFPKIYGGIGCILVATQHNTTPSPPFRVDDKKRSPSFLRGVEANPKNLQGIHFWTPCSDITASPYWYVWPWLHFMSF